MVGGGQAGLAMGHALNRRGLRGGEDFVILDAADQVGATWRDRWDSLRLFTPRPVQRPAQDDLPRATRRAPGKDDVRPTHRLAAHAPPTVQPLSCSRGVPTPAPVSPRHRPWRLGVPVGEATLAVMVRMCGGGRDGQ